MKGRMVESEIGRNGTPPVTGGEGGEPYRNPYRWVMLGLLWLLYAAFGLVLGSIAPLVTPILADLNMSYTQMGFILGSWPLAYIAVAMVAGAIIDKWGIRQSLLVGVIIIGLSATLRYFANSFVAMLLAVALFGVGGPMISIGCPKTISVWFRGKSRGTAVGIYMTGPWTGRKRPHSLRGMPLPLLRHLPLLFRCLLPRVSSLNSRTLLAQGHIMCPSASTSAVLIRPIRLCI